MDEAGSPLGAVNRQSLFGTVQEAQNSPCLFIHLVPQLFHPSVRFIPIHAQSMR